MRNHGIRYRRTFAVALALCTSAFVGLVGTPAAQAAPPTDHQNFFPNDNDGIFDQGGVDVLNLGSTMSDAEDGAGEEAHLTATATTDTTIVLWYVCPAAEFTENTDDDAVGGAAGTTFVQTELTNNCQKIGEDTTGVIPEAPTSPTGIPLVVVDEAYDVFWNIPASLDGQTRSIVSLACTSTPAAGAEISGGDCRAEGETDIYLEDAESGAAPTESAGEMLDWCPDPCLFTVPATNDQAFNFVHGDNWPNDDADVYSRTSTDVTGTAVSVVDTVDAVTDYEQSDPASDKCIGDLLNTTATYLEWECGDNDQLNVSDNDEMAVVLHDNDTTPTGSAPARAECLTNDAGTGEHANDEECAFDSHYVVTLAAAPSQVHIHNDQDTSDGDDDPGPTAADDDFCEDEDRTKTGTVGTGVTDELIGCIFDQFTEFEDLDGDGDQEKDTDHLMDEPGTFHITSGTATFTDCEGTRYDLDNDPAGLFEYCAVPDPDVIANDSKHEAEFEIQGTATPVQIEFCYDAEAVDETDPDFGCDDAGSLVDTANKNGEAGFDHVHLRFLEDYTANPNCITGAVSKDKPAGSVVNLKGCVHDEFENGAAGIEVIWRVVSGLPAQFGAVEQETDATGTADAAITAPPSAEGSATTVRFCTDSNSNGICDSDPADTDPGLFGGSACPGGSVGDCQADVQITWTKAVQPPPVGQNCPNGFDNVRGTKGNDKIKGDSGCDKIRGIAGNDLLKGRKGDDRLIGGPGNDRLNGGAGFDICSGNKGKDRFKGCERIKKR